MELREICLPYVLLSAMGHTAQSLLRVAAGDLDARGLDSATPCTGFHQCGRFHLEYRIRLHSQRELSGWLCAFPEQMFLGEMSSSRQHRQQEVAAAHSTRSFKCAAVVSIQHVAASEAICGIFIAWRMVTGSDSWSDYNAGGSGVATVDVRTLGATAKYGPTDAA